MKHLLALFASLAILGSCLTASASGLVPNEAGYVWDSMKIGGEGFVTGIVFHPKEEGLAYIRTDVGGAYRWNPSNETWIPLCDMFSREELSFYGIAGIALDPSDPDVIYMAAGMYKFWNGDVLKSTDRGNSWIRTGLDKTFGGNESNRALGECIAVDPNNSDILYVSTFADGMFMTDDGCQTWKPVPDSLDTTGSWSRSVTFDPTSAADGKSQTIYISVNEKGIFRTIDGGKSWTLMENSPANVKRMECAPSGTLYVASEKGLFRYQDGFFIEISPQPYVGLEFNDITIDPVNEDILMCLGPHSSPDNDRMNIPIWRSEDGGKTWVNKWTSGIHYTSQPWKYDSRYSSAYSSNSHCLKMNPFNNNEVWYTDFFSPHRCKDINLKPQQLWEMMYNGIEEAVPRWGIAPATGKYRFISAIADIDGLAFENPLEFPKRQLRVDRAEFYNHPWMMGSSDIDFCEGSPEIVLKVGIDWNSQGRVEYSLDNTESWNTIETVRYYVNQEGTPTSPVPYGRCAVSSQLHPETGKPIIIVIPAYEPNNTNKILPEWQNTLPLLSKDFGETWEEVKGLPEDTNIITKFWDKMYPITSDAVDGNRFYLFFDEQFYTSDDWGYTWTKTADIPCEPQFALINNVPGKAGEVWISAPDETGILRSADYGQTFARIEGITNVYAFGFGKAAPGNDYPTLYAYGEVNGQDGVYRSDDEGKTFMRINDDIRNYGSVGRFIVGDMQTYGVVYMMLDGRGFVTGMPEDSYLEFKNQMGSYIPQRAYETTVVYNGNLMDFSSADYHIMASYMYVPIRPFMEQAGCTDLVWNSDTYTFTAAKNGSVFEFPVVNPIKVNGVAIEKPINTPRLINNRMYVALPDVVKAMDAELEYNEELKQYYVID